MEPLHGADARGRLALASCYPGPQVRGTGGTHVVGLLVPGSTSVGGPRSFCKILIFRRLPVLGRAPRQGTATPIAENKWVVFSGLQGGRRRNCNKAKELSADTRQQRSCGTTGNRAGIDGRSSLLSAVV
jgi:hypothetical protein